MAFVVVAARFLLGAVFVVSAVEKVHDGRAFRRFVAETVRRGWTVRLSIVGTIAGELAATGLLLFPAAERWSVPLGFGLALTLLGVFSAVLGRALRREVRVPCGCFGASSKPPDRGHLLRNGTLAAVAAVGVVGSIFDTPAPLSTGAVVMAAVVVRLDALKTLFVKDIRGYE